VHLVAGDAVLASANHPDSHHPLIEAQGGILENGSDFDAELLLGLCCINFSGHNML